MLMALLLAAAGQSVLVGIVQYYGFASLRWLQPITASIIPALAWMAFLEASLRARLQIRDWVHFSVPAIVALCVFVLPAIIDVVLCSLFVGYGAAILVMLHRQGGDFAHMPLTSGHIPALVWRFIAFALIASAISDMLIIVAKIDGNDQIVGLILSITSSLALLTIGFLSLSPDIAIDVDVDVQSVDQNQPSDHVPATPSTPEHRTIMTRLEDLQIREQLYLDPDLTLARISRRMGVPLKQISTAINATTGENVSRFINKYRIEHACRELDKGETVTTTMLTSGFNTKSNFNREFLRITGKTPSQWQQEAQQP
ncbi:helix-turn-helix domain-containing protein [Thalassospira sp. MIT1004]|uniref:helix-turn-helix domain-containing protein n=2 Tax=Thalassospiraceae TaxID=2844866 RepID=UPI0009F520C0|nr:helix-turn-helix domain-containing protein [Thalassospira sp. MIT1004]MAB33535.1 AraC family transcriptional regulator [Thalassospira sp.]HBS23976.1 AraC family transcriptional regulator [Thalassospira sp.]|tara:strand:- start:18 stop:956 length:939 start_codon:yes stop_codon:yes gene_type:complete